MNYVNKSVNFCLVLGGFWMLKEWTVICKRIFATNFSFLTDSPVKKEKFAGKILQQIMLNKALKTYEK